MAKQGSLASYEMPPEFYSHRKVLDYPPDKDHTYLEACPKCGAVEEVSGHNLVNDYRIKCWKCGFASPLYPTFAKAIDVWNSSQYAHKLRKVKK